MYRKYSGKSLFCPHAVLPSRRLVAVLAGEALTSRLSTINFRYDAMVPLFHWSEPTWWVHREHLTSSALTILFNHHCVSVQQALTSITLLKNGAKFPKRWFLMHFVKVVCKHRLNVPVLAKLANRPVVC